jgi:hypothetical protein
MVKEALKQVRRNGTPFTIYFSHQQAESLNRISRERRVPKAELVRFGVDLMLAQLASGQLELPRHRFASDHQQEFGVTNVNYRFSDHETFPFRYAWLPQVVSSSLL